MAITLRALQSASVSILAFIAVAMTDGFVYAAENEPISFIGHGGFFDSSGKQIEVTQDFVENAQSYYSKRLLSSISSGQSDVVSELNKRFSQGTALSRQDMLLLQNRFLFAVSPISTDPDVPQIRAKINALDNALQFQLSEHSQESTPLSRVPRRTFVPDVSVRDVVEKQSLMSEQMTVFSSTASTGQKYLDECRASGVPIPPPMGKLDPAGKAGWRSLGFIPKTSQFIVGTPAEVRIFSSDTPAGMCFALPRYVDDSLQQIELDGAICLGQLSSKVCIWDNQMPATNSDGTTSVKEFLFGTGEQIPIGVPDAKIDPKGRYQAGGAEIEYGTGGICTDCHAGENPYIIHPKVDLGGGILMGKLNRPPLNLPTFSTNRYDPLAGASWPQNNFSLAEKLVPDVCGQCHDKDGPGGRFPLLSTDIKQYCGILKLAIGKTMPPNSPGSMKDDPGVQAFLKLCDSGPNSANADANP